MYIAIAGNIGSGKTSLTELLAKHYTWQPLYEDLTDNPYLYEFYADMQRWSFHLQMYFLGKRFQQIVDIRKTQNTVIQDRTIFEDANIFAANLHDMQFMTHNDYQTYLYMYDLLNTFVAPPDLLIYIRASVPTLVRQIQKRGRPYEAQMRLDYLKNLNDRYETWINAYPHRKIVVDVDEVNFIESPEGLSAVISQIDAELNGLF
jgi:deoxyadenosine/deoxycytidine kinase